MEVIKDYLRYKVNSRPEFQEDIIHKCKHLGPIIMQKHPDTIPIILIPKKNENYLKLKFLVPRDITFSKIIHNFVETNRLNPNMSYTFLVNNMMIRHDALISDIYQKYHHNYILYIYVLPENTFG